MESATVLLIDGDAKDERLIRGELASSCHLEIATTLEEGLAAIRPSQPALILLSLQLPDSTGLTTFLRVQAQAERCPIVVLVAKHDEDLALQAVARGAVDHVLDDELQGRIPDLLRHVADNTHSIATLRASEARFRGLYENVLVGVFQTTAEGRFIAVNDALVKLLGYESTDAVLALRIADDVYVRPEERDHVIRALAGKDESRNVEVLLKRKDGRRIVALSNTRVVRDSRGDIVCYEGTLTDITEAHEQSRQLSYEASHDALTGLVNRREFELRLERLLEASPDDGTAHAVCYLDLDQFKAINDTCGHVAGDELLRQLAHMLDSHMRAKDTLGRLGGDEFGVLLYDCALPEAKSIASSLVRAVEQHQFVWGSRTFAVGASIGLVPLDSRLRRVSDVLQAADAACYAAKDHGRNRVHLYAEDDTSIAQRNGEMQWAARVRRALGEGRFFLEAQPIVPICADGRGLHNYELLVRMRDESGRVVAPGAFLPAVERYNLAQRLDHWVMTTAFNWLAVHGPTLRNIGRVFVNLSGDSVADAELPALIRSLLAQTQVQPAKLGFEISETVAIGNLTRANHLISELRSLGCATGLDDFGSGVSSFAHLKALTVDFLKVDGLLTGNMLEDRVDLEMVRSITEIGHVMGKLIVAESVENHIVLKKLRELGVDYAQGFAVGVPASLTTLAGN
jgi:diguanylate cyclase (GGDEF)-like protein/PAS domain S-box-containing protein